MSTDMKAFLSQRGKAHAREMPKLMAAHFDVFDRIFDHKSNPSGDYLNFGTAENRLIDKDMVALLHEIQQDLVLESDHVHYNFFHGSRAFRTDIANYWQNVCLGKDNPRKLEAKNIVATTGVTEALEMLAFVLCDESDVILIPTPYYPGFVHDVESRMKACVVGVDCGLSLTPAAFEAALHTQVQAGKKVRAILFASPNNPLGHVYDEQAVSGLIDFAMRHDLDVISDEIYAQTIFDPKTKWTSSLALVPESYQHRVHMVAGFAKDFSLSGFRVGFCHSFHPALILALRELSYFSSVSSHTQVILSAVLKHPKTQTIIENGKKTLHQAYLDFEAMMASFDVPILPAKAGVFVLADFSKYLKEASEKGQMDLWQFIYDHLKTNLAPGHIFGAKDYGLFRICYAHPKETMAKLKERLLLLKNY